jgi:hypothetical protein
MKTYEIFCKPVIIPLKAPSVIVAFRSVTAFV